MYFTQRARLRLKSDANIWQFPVESLYHDHPDKTTSQDDTSHLPQNIYPGDNGSGCLLSPTSYEKPKDSSVPVGYDDQTKFSVFPDIVSITR